MNIYDESAESLMKRGDEIIAQKKRRAAIIRRTGGTAVAACAALVLGLGAWHNRDLKSTVQPPEPPIMAEISTKPSETTSAGTSRPTSAAATTATTAKATETVTTSAAPATTAQTAAITTVSTACPQSTSAPPLTTAAITAPAVPAVNVYFVEEDLFGETICWHYSDMDFTVPADAVNEELDVLPEYQGQYRLFSIKDVPTEKALAVIGDENGDLRLYFNEFRDYTESGVKYVLSDISPIIDDQARFIREAAFTETLPTIGFTCTFNVKIYEFPDISPDEVIGMEHDDSGFIYKYHVIN